MGVLALIGLGSNLGDRRANLESALDALRAMPESTLVAVSSYHETQAVGGPEGQQPFLNAAAAIETSIAPLHLLHILQAIETAAGRKREVRWGPRPIDLDLLLFGQFVIDSPDLVVPHLHFALRRFVLAPLTEVAPEALDPLTGRTVQQLLKNLDRRPSYVALAGNLGDENPLLNALAGDLPGTILITPYDVLTAKTSTLCEPGSLDLKGARQLLRTVAEPLRLDHWSTLTTEDRWLITSGCLDELFFEASERLDPASQPALRKFFLRWRAKTVQPTFVALDWVQSAEPVTEWVRQAEEDRQIGCDMPQLRVRGFDVEKFKALYDHTFSKDDRVMKQALKGLEEFRAKASSVYFNEIRAACAASRSSL